ncbi:hypothetical protein [Novosphingobium clariflavum]|uniref:Lipoprotein n=1 Tax=Novosphingobium clariflavum TaxID=2029884 RepID=A0ABV6S8X5_9SPHN|nr:hypothetical protein [Novosphingobium clariflavum]
MRHKTLLALASFACVQSIQPVMAQTVPEAAAKRVDPAAAPISTTTEPVAMTTSLNGLPIRHFSEAEVAAITPPSTQFTETPLIAADYDKYFFFNRAGTSFDEAYADVVECDALSSGMSYYGGGTVNPAAFAQYGVLPSAIGGAIGSVFVDAVFGSAERRKIRRINLRNCMGFKGYQRYGLEREMWQDFNFEEGLTRENAEARAEALLKQARVASGPAPQQKALGL